MTSIGAILGPATLRLLRVAVTNTTKTVRHKFTTVAAELRGGSQLQSIRSGYTGRQPVHPAALLKQQKRGARLFSSSSAAHDVQRLVRRFLSSGPTGNRAGYIDRSKLPVSKTSRRVAQFSGRAPFANALRPNLTGGAMPRTAGGYSLGGGGARYFSHTPAAPAQVVQNVSQAMRAFFVSGQKLRYDGVNSNGDRKYRASSTLEYDTVKKMQRVPKFASGAFIDFQLSPKVTAITPLAAHLAAQSDSWSYADAATSTLQTEGLLDILSADFGRTLKDMTATFGDLRRLSVLGDLPISLEKDNTIRVRFPGVDPETVMRLCDDLELQRGLVGQDAGFEVAVGVPVALQFPFAPDSDRTITSPGGSRRSMTSLSFDDDLSSLDDDSFVQAAFLHEATQNPWLSDSDEYESIADPPPSQPRGSEGFQGLEGIYRFLEECDRAKGRVT